MRKIPIEVVCPHCGITHTIAPWQFKRGQRYCCSEHEFADRKGKLRKYNTIEESKAVARERQKKYMEKNKELILFKKKLRRSTPEAKAKEKIRRAKYFEEHREQELKKGREYKEKNREVCLERVRQYSQTPKGKIARHRATHKRRSLDSVVTLTLDEWNKILENQDYKCAICGKPFNSRRKPTKDHIIPLSKGGGLTFENTQALCHSCNSGKSNKIDPQFIQSWIAIPS